MNKRRAIDTPGQVVIIVDNQHVSVRSGGMPHHSPPSAPAHLPHLTLQSTMASSKAPSHIRLPPQPDPADVFSRNTTSALSTTPLTPSAPNTPISPRGSPHIPGPRKSQSKQTLNADVGGSGARTRRTTFMDVSPSGEDRMNPPRRQARTSFSSSTGRYPRDRRMSRASTIGRRVSAAVSQAEGGDGDGKDDGEVAIPTLKLGIRPAYSTPLPLLPMVVLSVVSTEFRSFSVKLWNSSYRTLIRLLSSSCTGNDVRTPLRQCLHPFPPPNGRILLRSRRTGPHLGTIFFYRFMDRQSCLCLLHHSIPHFVALVWDR